MRVSRRCPAVLAGLCLPVALCAVAEREPEPWARLDSGLELRTLEGRSELDEPPEVTLLRVADAARVRVRSDPAGLRVEDFAAAETVVAALNANFFDSAGRPLGWVVADGEERSALGRSGWGVLSVSTAGVPRIDRPAKAPASETVEQAVQAGPILVEGGRPNPGLKAQRARRVFVGLDGAGRLVLGSTGPHAAEAKVLASLLARPPSEGGAGLREVLNLDGGSSAQLWVRGAAGEGDLLHPGLARVPVVLTVERAPGR